MATLSPPFILCPLPDRQALLGVCADRLPNKAIITLGRNIAIRYHILEQKQESSWTTSRYWFTSPVTYCHDLGKYGAILNGNIVALWDEGDSTLSNAKKLKLTEKVFGLHTSSVSRTVIVMNGGRAAFLSDVLNNKNLVKAAVLDPKETLLCFEVDERNDRAFLITRKETASKQLSAVLTSIGNDSNSKTLLTFGTDTHEILGFCVMNRDSETLIVYYCSNGHIYKKYISGKRDSDVTKMANLVKFVSSDCSVVLRPLLDSSCVAIYGSDPSEEGAVVLIYDTYYDVVVSKQPLKLYVKPPVMDRIGSSLLVPLGVHILVLNYKTTISLLSSLVGKHQAKLDEEVFEGRNPWISKGWDLNMSGDTKKSSNETKKDADESLALERLKETYPKEWEIIQQVKILESEGQPEAIICNHIIPSALELRNGAALDWILNTFLDIPEVHIMSIVVFYLKNVAISTDGSLNQIERLNQLFLRKFDRSLLTRNLRYVEYDTAKKLLMYINNLLNNNWRLDTDLEEDCSMKSWLRWCSCIIDAHYAKFVLHNDSDVIDNLLKSIVECGEVMKNIEELEPFLILTYSKTSFEPEQDTSRRWRTETVTFT